MISIIEKYGKQITKELLDIIIIKEKFNNNEVRDVLLKHNVIKKTTKTIDGYVYNCNGNTRNKKYTMNIRNGRGEVILNISFNELDIPTIINMLKEE